MGGAVLSGEEVDARLACVPALLDWATAGGTNDERHPNYIEVTEGLDPGRGHDGDKSSCAFLAHWLLFRLGCRQPWINRNEHLGWADRVNVSRLAFVAPLVCRRSPIPGVMASPGDIFICWNHPDGSDAHVFLCRREQRLPGQMTIAEYGQPAGHIRDRAISARDGYLYIGQRRIQRWLPIHLCVQDADERAQLADVSFPESFTPDTEPAPPMEEHDGQEH